MGIRAQGPAAVRLAPTPSQAGMAELVYAPDSSSGEPVALVGSSPTPSTYDYYFGPAVPARGRWVVIATGVRRDGKSVVIRPAGGSAADLAERLFREGYRRASIRSDEGREIGGVGTAASGARTWWGDTHAGAPAQERTR